MSNEPELPSAADAGRVGASTAELPTRGELPSRDAGGAGAAPPSTPRAGEGAPPPPPPEPSDSAADVAERIRAATAAGGLQALPADFGAARGDWQTVQSDEAFERLYLDWRQADRITPEMVRRHHGLLAGFWKDTIRSMQTGAAGQQIARRYGGRFASPEMVKSYPGELEKALHRLADAEGIRSAHAERVARRLAQARERLDPLVRQSLLDGALSPDEGEALLDEGARLGITRDETAGLVLETLAERGFNPAETVASSSPVDRLVGTAWISEQVQRSPRARNAFKFEGVAVHSLAELAAACGRHPDEARRYLYDGYLERWLAGDLGLAPLAARTKRILRDYSLRRDRGLEVFVRAVLEQAGIPAAPRMHAAPAALELGPLAQGRTVSARLALRELGGRYAWGTVVADPELPGLHVPAEFDGDTTLPLHLDTGWLPPGSYALSLWIRADGAAQPLQVAVRFEVLALVVGLEPASLLLATPFGRRAEQRLALRVTPADGVLLGTPVLDADIPGLSVQGQIAGAESEVVVHLDGRALRAGSRHSTELVLLTNAGELRLPVAVQVEFERWRAGLWGLLGAVLGGLGMMMARQMVADSAGEPRWILSLEQMSGLYGAAVLAFALLVVGIFLLRWATRGPAAAPATPPL